MSAHNNFTFAPKNQIHNEENSEYNTRDEESCHKNIRFPFLTTEGLVNTRWSVASWRPEEDEHDHRGRSKCATVSWGEEAKTSDEQHNENHDENLVKNISRIES